MSKVLGIDLGTAISKMAIVKDGEPKCVENREGSTLTPSIVALTKKGERLTGVLAKRQAITNPKNTIHSVKRFIGRRFSDKEVQEEIKRVSYEVRERKDGGVEVKLGDEWKSPISISSMILQKLKMDAEEKLGEKINSAVITCPANFDDSQRKAVQAAGDIAGLKVLRIINEPTAAALAYGIGKKKEETIVVYDFGGGTFDVSILNISPDVVEVLATEGGPHLGGNDFDQRIMNWLAEKFKKDQGVDLMEDPLALQRLKEAAEKAKQELSSAMETEINLPFISSTDSGPKHLNYTLSRAKFNDLTRDLVERSIDIVKKTLKQVNLKEEDLEKLNKAGGDNEKLEPNEVDGVVLVGGTTLIPAIREAVKEFFGKEADKSINPQKVVAMGAAMQGEILRVKKEGGSEEDAKSVLLLDVLPLSLGMETLGAVNTVMIPKNTTIPTSKTKTFSTAADNQTTVQINVLQGERPMAQDNRSLGQFVLSDLPPAPRGVPKIDVTFDIDSNGILSVTAKDQASGKSQSIRIEGSIGLSDEKIEEMKREAEKYAEEDKKKRELIKVKNDANNLVYLAEKALRDSEGKISDNVKKEIEEKVEDLKKVKEGDSIEDIKNKTSELSKVVQQVGAEMYKKAQEQKKAAGGSEEKAEEGNYKEKKTEDKKDNK